MSAGAQQWTERTGPLAIDRVPKSAVAAADKFQALWAKSTAIYTFESFDPPKMAAPLSNNFARAMERILLSGSYSKIFEFFDEADPWPAAEKPKRCSMPTASRWISSWRDPRILPRRYWTKVSA